MRHRREETVAVIICFSDSPGKLATNTNNVSDHSKPRANNKRNLKTSLKVFFFSVLTFVIDSLRFNVVAPLLVYLKISKLYCVATAMDQMFIDKARIELGETELRKAQSLQLFREWLAKHPFLSCIRQGEGKSVKSFGEKALM